jgi:tetratricopeptide (TPR) repeat protein
MGRYEEALATADEAIATARKLGRPDNVVLNYSTTALREIYAVDEALERSETVVSRLGPSDFNMPWMNARADVVSADLLLGDIGAVERAWPAMWDDALASHAWERWLLGGKLAAVRAEAELQRGRPDEAIEWSGRAIELARSARRRKYETAALVTLGRALAARGLADEAAAELRRAVEVADGLGSPLSRWQARAALALAVPGVETEALLVEAAAIINAVAGSLTPERGARYLAAPQVRETLAAAGAS